MAEEVVHIVTYPYVAISADTNIYIYIPQVCESEAMRTAQAEVRNRWGLVYGLPVLVVLVWLYQDGTAITKRMSVTPVMLFFATLSGSVHKKLLYHIRLGMLGNLQEDTLPRPDGCAPVL